MDPAAITILEKVADKGVVALILFVAVYYLSKRLEKQYDGRITFLEVRTIECERDRVEMRKEMRSSQNERIGVLEKLLTARDG